MIITEDALLTYLLAIYILLLKRQLLTEHTD